MIYDLVRNRIYTAGFLNSLSPYFSFFFPNSSSILMSSSCSAAMPVKDFLGGLQTERGLDRARGAFPMVDLQGEQTKHSCCASGGLKNKEKYTE